MGVTPEGADSVRQLGPGAVVMEGQGRADTMCVTSIRRIAEWTRSHSFTWSVPRCNGRRLRMTMVGIAPPEKGITAVARVVVPSG